MSEHPLISIVLPVHNEGRWLEQCFASLLGQTYPSVEIVCIDDFSTDTSWDLIQTFQKKHPDKVVSFRFDKNSGEGAARNKGIEIAHGTFIIESDADTIFPTDFVEKAYDTYTANSADGLSLGYLKVHPDRKGILADYWRAKRAASAFIRTQGKKEEVASMFFFKKETALAIGGYDASIPSGTDFDFGMRARQHGMTIVPATEVFFYHADVTDWKLFYKRLFNAARYDMPIKKRWGRWLTVRQVIQQSAQGVVATVLLIAGLIGFIHPVFFFSWIALFAIEGLMPLLIHKETRVIVKLLKKDKHYYALIFLPFITFLRIRASNYGKLYAVLFPLATAKSVTFDV